MPDPFTRSLQSKTEDEVLKLLESTQQAKQIELEEDEEAEDMVDMINPETGEIAGPRGKEPTRYGDWEVRAAQPTSGDDQAEQGGSGGAVRWLAGQCYHAVDPYMAVPCAETHAARTCCLSIKPGCLAAAAAATTAAAKLQHQLRQQQQQQQHWKLKAHHRHYHHQQQQQQHYYNSITEQQQQQQQQHLPIRQRCIDKERNCGWPVQAVPRHFVLLGVACLDGADCHDVIPVKLQCCCGLLLWIAGSSHLWFGWWVVTWC